MTPPLRAVASSLTASVALRKRSGFFAAAGAAPVVLAVAHLFPASGPGLGLRLAGAAACVLLLPGALLLRALAWPASPGVALAASFGLSLFVLACALGLVFVAGASILLAAGAIAFVSAFAAIPAALREASQPVAHVERRALGAVLAAAAAFAGVVWWAVDPLRGDAFFHVARARKLAELDSLTTLSMLSEFENGSLHPGYAFPLWHAVDAVVARLAGVDVAEAVLYLPAVLVPLAFVLVYAAGAALFRAWAGGVALVAAYVAQIGFFRQDGALAGSGLFEHLSLPQAASRVLLTTAVLALAFAFIADGEWMVLAALGAAGLALTAVHPTYTPYVALLVGGFLLARFLLVRGWEALLTRATMVLGALLAPLGLMLILLFPHVRATQGFTPSPTTRAEELAHYGDIFTTLGDWFGLSPSTIAGGGPVVAVGLLAVPLAAFASRRLWAAFVLGGSLLLLVVTLVPPLFTALSDVLSVSQARRLPQFLPISFAFAGACVILSPLRGLGVGLAAAAGVSLAILYPGELTHAVGDGGPGWAVWVALAGGLTAVVAGVLVSRSGPSPSAWSAAAAAAFVAPIIVGGLSRIERTPVESGLTPGIVAAVRIATAPGDVLFSDKWTAYKTAAFAPVYINAAPIGHATDTQRNRVRARVGASRSFFRRPLTNVERRAILNRYGADWVLVDKNQPHPQEFPRRLRLVYQDARYTLYQVRP